VGDRGVQMSMHAHTHTNVHKDMMTQQDTYILNTVFLSIHCIFIVTSSILVCI
jgi:hypothetical protein